MDAAIDLIDDQVVAAGSVDVTDVARTLYAQRRLRNAYFPAKLFKDPAWDLLLSLYIARSEGRELTTTAACLGADVPGATGVQWLNRLESLGIVSRGKSDRDIRLTLAELTDEAFEKMTSLLLKLAQEGPL